MRPVPIPLSIGGCSALQYNWNHSLGHISTTFSATSFILFKYDLQASNLSGNVFDCRKLFRRDIFSGTMAEALAIVGLVSSIVQFVDYSSKLVERLSEFQSNLGE